MTLLDEAPAPVADAPALPLHPRVVTLWRVGSAISWLMLTAAAVTATFAFERSPWLALPVAVLGVAWVIVVPPFQYRHFRYRVSDVDLRIMHGWLWRHVVVVMHSRIQHVDTQQGPVERMLGLATVVVYTAGSVGARVAIPGLAALEAHTLRERLAAVSEMGDAV
jgi:membrane protein YdbS with pleckstrin-like domain